MARIALKYNLDAFLEKNKEIFKEVKCIKVELYFDAKNIKEIIDFLKTDQKKFRRILYEILQGRYNESLYRKENISEKAKDLTAMKFSGKNNPRIYCKEFHDNLTKKIVMVEFLRNKDFQNAGNNKLKPRLETIGGYEYEFKEKLD